MGKVVILGGNARSGKSTLAFQLVKKGFNRISFDNIYAALEEGLKIKIDNLDEKIQFAFFENIVNKSLEEAENEDINIVIDMYDFLPHHIQNIKNKNKLEVYFLAYPNCSKEQIKYNVIHYAKKTDWISQVNETYLDSCIERFYNRNQLLVEECKKFEMNLIDTKYGKDRSVVLKKLFNKILSK